MSAHRHATDANSEALRLHLAIQDLCERNALGENISPEQLGDLLRKSACVQYHSARTQYAVSQFEARREAEIRSAIPTLAAACHG
jgi:hypothetical protein